MELGNHVVLEQRQQLTQSQVQSLNILAFNNQELNEFMENEYIENPLLDHATSTGDDTVTSIDSFFEIGASFKDNYIDWGDEDSNRSHDIPAKDANALKLNLMLQLPKGRYSKQEWKLIELLIECLDEDGFFTMDIDEVAKFSGYSPKIIEKCLEDLKDLEPAGIFSRDLSQCLLKQMEKLGVNEGPLIAIVKNHMTDILNGHIGAVSRALRLTTAQVKKYMLVIGRLNPRPIMDAYEETQEYVIPDLIVSRQNQEWMVELNDKWMGDYKLNDYYIKMMQSTKDEALSAYFREKLERARFLTGCIEKRRNTIVKITQAIIDHQKDYFQGKNYLKPMSLNDIAVKIEMHPSTVSRAIKGKYLQYQFGIVLLKDLFSSATLSQEGQSEVSADYVHNLIKELIAKEDKKKPLSDMALVKELEKQDVHISRRTVAKYRGEMNIMDSNQRKFYE